jgi:hypothetical protein
MFALVIASLSVASIRATFAGIPRVCQAKAVRAVARFVPEGRYDEGGFSVYDCRVTSNRVAVACGVSASKGGGEAFDTYRVILNRDCERVYRVELIGEE